MCEIFLVNTSEVDNNTQKRLLSLLPCSEQNKISAKRNGKNSLFGALLVRFALKKAFGISPKDVEILREKSGKPYLKDFNGIHISISHSDNIVVCAVSDKPVGIDVQKIEPVSSSVINRTCSEDEIREISESDDAVSTFIYTWTKKEAVLKKRGTGILDEEIKSCIVNENFCSLKYENYWISCTV